MNAIIGGSRTIEYTENMHRLSDSMKKDLEKKTDYPTNLVIYIGYSFWEHIMIKYILVLVFRQETLLLKVKDLEHQLNLSQLLWLLMHLDDITWEISA